MTEWIAKKWNRIKVLTTFLLNRKCFKLSFIEDWEEKEAKRIIENQLGFEVPHVPGYHVAVKIYVREEEISTFIDEFGNKKSFVLPASVTVNDKFRSYVGLVIARGNQTYKGWRFKGSGPWCRVGDWIVFPRNEGIQYNYRGIPIAEFPDDKVYGIIQDPTYVTRD